MTNLSFCCRFWVDWTTSWHVTLDSWEVVSVRASSGPSILPVALETLRIPD